ncbi:MAG: dUTP diphosphatase [Myxococcales bacterium]|nr:dUTP diphosphatase [Myxococcales bacterium]
MRLSLRRLDGVGPPLPLPCPSTPNAAGLDLSAALLSEQVIEPGARLLVPTGFAWAIPEGFEGQVRPRSGRALSEGLTVLNAPGTIDADYRGEVAVLLVNLGQAPVTIRRGDRIAQMIVAPVVRVMVEEVKSLDDTSRGSGGFGHSGT